MRLLLVEDDRAVVQSMQIVLRSSGFEISITRSGEEALELGKMHPFDLIVLDLSLPDLNGFDVLRRLRIARVETPVLILSGQSGLEAKVRALGLGADDYLTKPFHRDELLARIHAVIRRAQGHTPSVIHTGELTINLDAKTASIDNRLLALTSKEFSVLEMLALRKGHPVCKDVMLANLYSGMDEPDIKIIDVFICHIRKKIKAASSIEYIDTISGLGYRLRSISETTKAMAA